MGLFGKTPSKSPKEQVQEWNSKIRKEGFQLERQIRAIKREEDKVKKTLKEAAKKGDKDVCTILAKEVVHARKTIAKIYTSKAQLMSIQNQMKNQLAVVRVTGSLEKSTEVMKAMQDLVKVPEVAATMRDLSKEMMKAGIIEEMIDDTMETMEDDSEEMEEAAQEEVDKILYELTAGQLGKAPEAVTDSLPAAAEPATAQEESDEGEELEEMKTRLEALRS